MRIQSIQPSFGRRIKLGLESTKKPLKIEKDEDAKSTLTKDQVNSIMYSGYASSVSGLYTTGGVNIPLAQSLLLPSLGTSVADSAISSLIEDDDDTDIQENQTPS